MNIKQNIIICHLKTNAFGILFTEPEFWIFAGILRAVGGLFSSISFFVLPPKNVRQSIKNVVIYNIIMLRISVWVCVCVFIPLLLQDRLTDYFHTPKVKVIRRVDRSNMRFSYIIGIKYHIYLHRINIFVTFN